jgi:glucose/arabinose dehydrogenase
MIVPHFTNVHEEIQYMTENDNSSGLVVAAAVVIVLLILVLVALICGGLFVLLGSQLTLSANTPNPSALQPTPTAPPVLWRDAPPVADQYTWQPVANDFDSPLAAISPPDGTGRIMVVEQQGLIFVVQPDGRTEPTPFLDISELLPASVFLGSYTEQGLLGLSFPPDYAQSGRFYISYTNFEGDSVIARYHISADPNEADSASAEILLKVDQPFSDHNGGNIVFGPDGMLWAGFGDGGNVNEPNTRSLDPMLLLGKMIRIDVSGDQVAIPADNPFVNTSGIQPEIWASGLRNPWRFSFDRKTGDLYIGDVGQWTWEEVNFQPATSTGGENYGWSAYEGTHIYLPDVTIETPVAMPFYEYPHQEGCSVTGGYVYRGESLKELEGYYFFGDYCNGIIWVSYRNASGEWQTNPFMDTDFVISSFGQSENGELYLVDYKGGIYKLSLKVKS